MQDKKKNFYRAIVDFFCSLDIYIYVASKLPLSQIWELTVSISSDTARLMVSHSNFMCPTERINRPFMIKMSTQMAWTYRQRTVIKSSQLRFSRFSIKSCTSCSGFFVRASFEDGRRKKVVQLIFSRPHPV